MSPQSNVVNQANGKMLKFTYVVTLFFLALSGFAQMPIFKRYYIADIPGLGWLAKFYVTHTIHYLGAILILGLLAYILIQYVLIQKGARRITTAGYIRGALLAGILATGLFLVLRNLAGVRLSPGFIIFLDISHLGLVMTFLMAALYCLVFKKEWTKSR